MKTLKFKHQIDSQDNKDTHIQIDLVGVGKNRQLDLDYLQTQIGKIPITIRLDQEYIYISFEDKRKKIPNKPKKPHYSAGIDMNPNYIGFTILSQQNQVVTSRCYDISKITCAKQDNELIHITEQIANICEEHGVNKIGIEKLEIKSHDHEKGRNFNRLVNNKWNRCLFVSQLKKRMAYLDIEVVEVLAQYSSYIGNLVYSDLVDPCASAAEIARRAKYQYEKELCIWNPYIPTNYSDQWKETDSLGKKWKQIIGHIKNSGMKYRVLLDQSRDHAVCRFMSKNSQVLMVCYS